MKIVLATRNGKKVEELKRMFAGSGVSFVGLEAFPGCPDVEEDGNTFRANAVKKALFVARFTGRPAVADDSGLEVSALGGEPGVYSARYAGERAGDRENLAKLMRHMRGVMDEERQAQFVCCIAFALPDGKVKTFSGYVKGRIGRRRRGANGFGYDPVFYPLGHDRTFAQMTDAEKDGMSHRGKAIRKLQLYLMKIV